MSSQTTLIWKGYEAALHGLSCKDMDGNVMEPEIALVKFKDGWRQFAHHNGIEGVSTTSWPIDPKQILEPVERIAALPWWRKIWKKQ